MHCVIVSPEKRIYDGPADVVLLPSTVGQLGIMRNHQPLFTQLDPGIIVIRNGDEEIDFTISAGFAHVAENFIQILSEASESIDEIDVKRAEEARERAIMEMQKTRTHDTSDFLEAMMKLKRSELRLKAVHKYGNSRKKPLK